MRYKFELQKETSGTAWEAYPSYKSDIAFVSEREPSQMFYRTKLSSALTFCGLDYDALMGNDFETQYIVTIICSEDGKEWRERWKGYFYLSDCEISEDDRTISVTPAALDQYSEFLQMYDEEIELATLPHGAMVRSSRPNGYEFALGGDGNINVLTRDGLNTLPSTYGSFPRSITSDTLPQMMKEQDLYLQSIYVRYSVQGSSSGIRGAIDGTYEGVATGHGWSNDQWNYTTVFERYQRYEVASRRRGETAEQGKEARMQVIHRLTILAHVNHMGEQYYETGFNIMNEGSFLSFYIDGNEYHTTRASYNSDGSYLLELSDGNTATFRVEEIVPIWGRYASTNTDYDGVRLDFYPPKPLYEYDYPSWYAGVWHGANEIKSTMMFASTQWSTEDSGYGYFEIGGERRYYCVPNNETEAVFRPIFQAYWTEGVSFWAIMPNAVISPSFLLASGVTDLMPCYDMQQVISGIHSAVFGRPIAVSSQLMQQMSGSLSELYFTQNSNFRTQSHNAINGNLSIKQILDMYKSVFNAYWHIDSSGNLHIEHYRYYRNGGSYEETDVVSYDLTTLAYPRNGKLFEFGQVRYSWNVEDFAKKYTWQWADGDASSTYFNGNPIRINSRFAKSGKVEETSISRFDADYPSIVAAPEEFNRDNFTLIAAKPNSEAIQANRDITTTQFYQLDFLAYRTEEAVDAEVTVDLDVVCNGSMTAAAMITLSDGHATIGATYTIYNGFNSVVLPPRTRSLRFTAVEGTVHLTSVKYTTTAYARIAGEGITNGELSLTALQPIYWIDALPSKDVTINRVRKQLTRCAQNKQQKLKFAVDDSKTEPDPTHLVKTSLGKANAKTISVSFENVVELNLLYDNY